MIFKLGRNRVLLKEKNQEAKRKKFNQIRGGGKEIFLQGGRLIHVRWYSYVSRMED